MKGAEQPVSGRQAIQGGDLGNTADSLPRQTPGPPGLSPLMALTTNSFAGATRTFQESKGFGTGTWL